MTIRPVLVAAVLLLTGCPARDDGGDAQQDTAQTASPAPNQPAAEGGPSALAPRPATRLDTIAIEGMPEEQRSTLVQSPRGFFPPFSTYVPDGMTVQTRADGGAAALRIVAAFGGAVNPDAYVEIESYPAGSGPGDIEAVIASVVRGRTTTSPDLLQRSTPPWSLASRGFRYRTGGVPFTGSVTTGERSGRYFHVIVHHPAEYGDGMGPRIDRILEQWRWEDDGRMLRR